MNGYIKYILIGKIWKYLKNYFIYDSQLSYLGGYNRTSV